MIPFFDENGNLPPGIYTATLSELERRFSYNADRLRLFTAFKDVVKILQECKCRKLYLDGSFVTDNKKPNDYDMCFEPMGMKPTKELRQIILDLETAKKKYLGDIFIRFPRPPFYFDHVIEWQKDRDGNAKGIIELLIENEHD